MKIAAIIVIYKNTQNEITEIKNSLLVNGIAEKDIYFSDNNKKNLGFGGGINRVLKSILKVYDFFLIVNPDVIIHKKCLKYLNQTLFLNSSIGIVGPKILDEKGRIWSIGGELDKRRYSGGLIGYGKQNTKSRGLVHVDFISGTAMLIRRDVFEAIGLFAEDYFLYYEDVDFCLRVQKVGLQLVIDPRAEVTHFASSVVGKNSPTMQYYMARNHLWIVERYGSLAVKLYEYLRMPKTLFDAREKKYEILGIRDYLFRKVGRYDYWG